MSYQISREKAQELGHLYHGRVAARFTGEQLINTAIAAGEQIMRELDTAYQQQITEIVAECGLPEGTTIKVHFDTGEVEVMSTQTAALAGAA